VSERLGPVRPGEELDVDAVHGWLAERLPGLGEPPEVSQFSGGASNWTYLLRYPDRELVLRRPPAGTKARSAHDMGREVRVQRGLRPVFGLVPEIVGHCEDPDLIGSDFYVMHRIPGLIPRSRMPVELSPEQHRSLCDELVDRLVELHAVDHTACPDLAELGRGAGYTRRQIEGWSERFRRAKTWNVPGCERVMTWLADHLPDDVDTCVIHGDYRLDNVVLDPDEPTRIVGVLDWEMATLGDPLMDLGNALAYWVQADDDFIARSMRRQPTHLPGMLTRAEVVQRYCERSGLQPDNWTFYEVYGLFRLAGIVQQIYYRYHRKETRNPAFRRFWLLTHYLDRRCRRLIRRAS